MTTGNLPSFREQLAVVYDDYLSTLGGGERSALAYARALAELGFTVELVSTLPVPERAAIRRAFGPEFDNVTIRHMPVKDVYHSLAIAGLSVFVNHTFLSFKRSPAKIGIYAQMFPVTSVNRRTHPIEVKQLESYQLVLSNSSFTKTYTDARWELPKSRSDVLHPPIASKYTDRVPAFLAKKPAKSKRFVHVGRFNPGTHNKNQKIIIETFLEAAARYPALAGWRLSLIGNSNKDEASQKYLADCKALAASSSGRVEILQDLDEDALGAALLDAYGYVHATGAFHMPGESPHVCEHLGLSIVEAAAHACIPLVYARGGIFDILDPGTAGLPYITRDGLIEGFGEIAGLHGTPAGETVQDEALRCSLKLSFTSFKEKLASFLAQELGK